MYIPNMRREYANVDKYIKSESTGPSKGYSHFLVIKVRCCQD